MILQRAQRLRPSSDKYVSCIQPTVVYSGSVGHMDLPNWKTKAGLM